MVNNIPENCILTFSKKFNEFPSIYCIEPPYKVDNFVKDVITKRHKLWVTKKITPEGESFFSDVLLEYDPTGILFYIKDETTIFVLCVINKMDIVDFTIHKLKK
jgi:hypothetical protein